MQMAFDFSAQSAVAQSAVAPPVVAPPAFVPPSPVPANSPARLPSGRVDPARVHRGRTNHLAGLSAEDSVARRYDRSGRKILKRRFRGRYGEVDLVVQEGDTLVFVEVKRGRSHDTALSRVSHRQFERIYAAATEFVEASGLSPLTDMRFDVATVDQAGCVQLHPGILAHF